ncbi:MAG TPA: hypothetical protein PKX17_00105, partial [Candidatus Methanomethylicus sp.]|nr:hypothetical protein [Candidatus Methanomethylicus sp.]
MAYTTTQWVPRTSLGKQVLEGKITSIREVFEQNIPIGKNSGQDFSPGKIPTQAPIVTVEVNQRSIFRLQNFQGYLGDLQHTFVSAPFQAAGLDAYGKNIDKHAGLFR